MTNSLAAALARLGPAEVSVALHTADPGECGSNEATYAGYARVNVALPPPARIDFPRGTDGAGYATHYSVGSVGGTEFFFAGPLMVPIPIGYGLTPHVWTER